MDNVVLFTCPRSKKLTDQAAELTANTLSMSVTDSDNNAYLEDVTTTLVKVVYKTIYMMYEKKVSPETIMREADFILETLQQNIPTVKQNIWNWAKEASHESGSS